MSTLETTRLSSKGQVVIPEAVRAELGLEVGAKFLVIVEGDYVVLKRISPPDRREVREMATKVRKQASSAGVRSSDVAKAVRASRRRG
jgi:AbrB family looped-hinge helix DNA binding protein